MLRKENCWDVVVIGAGLAGMHCAIQLQRSGLRVLLADRKRSVSQGVRTTGIFVRRTLEKFALPGECLGPAVRRVSLYSPSLRRIDLESPYDEFRVASMGRLYEWFLAQAVDSGVTWLPAASFLGMEPHGVDSRLYFLSPEGRFAERARFVIGADGADSAVARALGLSRNREWIVGMEDIYRGVPLAGEPAFHCFLDPRLAPGYLAWIVNDGRELHSGVGGYPSRFRPAAALQEFTAGLDRFFDMSCAERLERRAGRIPVGGVLPRIACPAGLLVGDAAGAVSPLTAGGLDPCLRLSSLAAEVAAEYLRSGDPGVLQQYDGRRFRRRFSSRLWMRRALNLMTQPLAMEAAFRCLQTPPLRALVWKVFFGCGSFPDVQTDACAESA